MVAAEEAIANRMRQGMRLEHSSLANLFGHYHLVHGIAGLLRNGGQILLAGVIWTNRVETNAQSLDPGSIYRVRSLATHPMRTQRDS